MVFTTVFGGKLERGFEALEIYNYFEAKELFEKSMKKRTAGAAYGLSLIYANDKNPFHNREEAYVFILKSDSAYQVADEKEREKLLELNIDSLAILTQKKVVSTLFYQVAKSKHTVESYQEFIDQNPWADEYKEAIRKRNQLAFERVKELDTYQAYDYFMKNYPDALEIEEAQQRYDKLFYQAKTKTNTIGAYQAFIQNYPENPYAGDAQDQIYALSTASGKTEDYLAFIHNNPDNRNVNSAWAIIYKLETKDYSPESISEFLLDYPDYPYRDQAFVDFNLSKVKFLPIKEGVNGTDKWGYIDTNSTVRISPAYDYVGWFNDGLAPFSEKGKMGFINKKGEEVIAAQYEEVFAFHEGRAIVILDDLYGVVNKLGKYVVAPEYDELGELNSNRMYALKGDHYGYLDENGEMAIPFVYTMVYDFKGNYAVVEKDTAYGIIDVEGDTVFPFLFEKIDFITPQLFKAKNNNLWGILHINGDTVVPFEQTFIGELSDNRMIKIKEGNYTYINVEGEEVIKGKYDYDATTLNYAEFKNGYALYKLKNKFGMIDTLGKRIFPAIFESIGEYTPQLTAVKRYGKWGYANADVELEIKYKYDYAWKFINGWAKIEKEGLVGLIDTLGNEVIPAEYNTLEVLDSALVLVETTTGKYGVIRQDTTEVLPVIFTNIERYYKQVYNVEIEQEMALYDLASQAFIYTEQGFAEALKEKTTPVAENQETEEIEKEE